MGWLLVKKGRQTLARVPLGSAPVTIGRLADCDVRLDAPHVSGRHAVVAEAGGMAGVTDLGSANGTFLHNRRVDRPVQLHPGDHVRIADYLLQYLPDGMQTAAPSRVPVAADTERLAIDPAKAADTGRLALDPVLDHFTRHVAFPTPRGVDTERVAHELHPLDDEAAAVPAAGASGESLADLLRRAENRARLAEARLAQAQAAATRHEAESRAAHRLAQAETELRAAAETERRNAERLRHEAEQRAERAETALRSQTARLPAASGPSDAAQAADAARREAERRAETLAAALREAERRCKTMEAALRETLRRAETAEAALREARGAASPSPSAAPQKTARGSEAAVGVDHTAKPEPPPEAAKEDKPPPSPQTPADALTPPRAALDSSAHEADLTDPGEPMPSPTPTEGAPSATPDAPPAPAPAADAGLIGDKAEPDEEADIAADDGLDAHSPADFGDEADPDENAGVADPAHEDGTAPAEADPSPASDSPPGIPEGKVPSGGPARDAEQSAVGEFEPLEEAFSAEPARPDAAPKAAPPISDAFRAAIEARLAVHLELADLADERLFLREHMPPGTPEGLLAELDRQDREAKTFPAAEQAADRLAKRRERQQREEAQREALSAEGKTPPPVHEMQPMLATLADRQLECFIQHDALREPLVSASRPVYAAEPLLADFAAIPLDAAPLLALSVHRLALEALAAEAVDERKALQAVAQRQAAVKPKPRRFGLFGGKNAAEAADAAAESPEAAEARLARRGAAIAREIELADAWLLNEYWRLYAPAARWFAGDDAHRAPPAPVRAFLRWGLVGVAPWFIDPERLAFVTGDCVRDVRPEWPRDADADHPLYADEYLLFVADRTVTPGPDERLELTARNSPEWKADRALRRAVAARLRVAAFARLRARCAERLEGLRARLGELEPLLTSMSAGGASRDAKRQRRELQEKVQTARIDVGRQERLIARIDGEWLPHQREQIADAEAVLASDEFTVTRDYLVDREVAHVRRLGNLCANLRERYPAWGLREFLNPQSDQSMDRRAILERIREVERLDPGVFLETVMPSKRKPQRVDVRWSPIYLLLPAAGLQAYAWTPRAGMEMGKLAVPLWFIRPRLSEKAFSALMADYRFDTAKANAGMDLMTSDTFVAAFMKVRWNYRKRAKEMREKAGIHSEQNDRANWRRIYGVWLGSAADQGRKLFYMNYDIYNTVFCPYFDLPEGVDRLRK